MPKTVHKWFSTANSSEDVITTYVTAGIFVKNGMRKTMGHDDIDAGTRYWIRGNGFAVRCGLIRCIELILPAEIWKPQLQNSEVNGET